MHHVQDVSEAYSTFVSENESYIMIFDIFVLFINRHKHIANENLSLVDILFVALLSLLSR